MKYLLKPILNVIKVILQILLAIIITIIWGSITLIYFILYTTFVSLWEFKLKILKLDRFRVNMSDDSISYGLLWSDGNFNYKTYFHCIWNIQKPLSLQTIINKFYNN